MPIIPYEGGPAPGEETAGMERTGGGGGDVQASGSAAPADDGKPKTPQTESEKAAAEHKRAQAIATLSYYGLTDPTSQEELAKAVQAVAAATSDQTTAVALWHMCIGSEDGGEG